MGALPKMIKFSLVAWQIYPSNIITNYNVLTLSVSEMALDLTYVK